MSYEAVPCMFRSSTQNGNGETQYLGLLIRPSVNQPNAAPGTPATPIVGRNANGQPVTTLTPAPNASKAPQPLLVQGVYPQGGPIVVQGETPKHRSLSVCSASPQLDSSPMSPLPNIVHYHNHPTPSSTRVGLPTDPRATRVPSTTHWTAPISDSSTTPDSGIQSVPCTPPSSQPLTPPNMQLEGCDSVCEERCDNDEDFADMPRLLPIDQEESQYSNSCLSVREDVASAHGSECETAPTPSISITPSMDSKDIVEQLLMLDPEKANAIANLIKRRQSSNKRRSGSKQEGSQKRARPTSSASEDPKKSEEEPTPVPRVTTRSTSRASQKDGAGSNLPKLDTAPSPAEEPRVVDPQEISPVPSEQVFGESPSSEERRSVIGLPPSDHITNQAEMRMLYREAIKRMLKEKLDSLVERTVVDLQALRIGLRERHDRRNSKERKNSFAVNWELVKRKRKKEDDRRRTAERTDKRKDVTPKKTEIECKKEQKDENHEISPRNDPVHEKRPRKRRHDTDLLTRPPRRGQDVVVMRQRMSKKRKSMRKFLEKFWREDAIKSLAISSVKTRKTLKTRQARRAGEFLCEFAGEVVRFEEAKQRWETYLKTETAPIILCLTSCLFVDATVRGNISRHVRHS
ncbi:unnamed protein product [Nippostrongylus brasiliensis]|uniref:MYND-type domain-containing protein n=1 Tax=Nippostrongylus brasiliensis TaxID=27835 RepID=A0A158QYC9_NIPBR|nr:unnamed protein product [Nippostrongylus brasiliensis]